MNDKEKLEKAQHLLREWMYELSNLDTDTSSDGRDYQRLCAKTEYYLEVCDLDLENDHFNLSTELIKVLERAKAENTYFNPWVIAGVINGIEESDPDADKKISDELSNWAMNMFSR